MTTEQIYTKRVNSIQIVGIETNECSNFADFTKVQTVYMSIGCK